jgi:integrase
MAVSILEQKDVVAATKSLSDGGQYKGLMLLVKGGRKYWVGRYTWNGKRPDMRLGVFSDQHNLEWARKQHEERVLKPLSRGKNPKAKGLEFKAAVNVSGVRSFRSYAEEWYELRKPTWTSVKYTKAVEARLVNHVYNVFGPLPVDQISTPMVKELLKKFHGKDKKSAKLETRDKVLEHLRGIFSLAMDDTDVNDRPIIVKNPAAFDMKNTQLQRRKGNLKSAHRRMLVSDSAGFQATWKALPGFWREIDSYRGNAGNGLAQSSGQSGLNPLTRLGLKLLVLTMVRPVELREAVWDEFDFDENVWVIPASRMKMDYPHVVPLSRQVVVLLNELRLISGDCRHLFPKLVSKGNGFDDSGTQSEATLQTAVYRMGYEANPHGFRRMASTFLHSQEIGEEGEERGMFDSLWIEFQLAHVDVNKVRKTYNESDYLKARRRMLQHYADAVVPAPQLQLVSRSA